MVAIDPETKKSLKEDGLMTRDARKVERKKPGQKKARKRFQFTKR
ncbi:MAG TPA: 30S ribosomal protein S9, partial [Bacteroidia bacterium]|nr:30S ribosomal protein S9 [Bacteroidia bacterium]